jgi:replicative DNA helicase
MSNVVKLEPVPGRVPPSDLDAEAAVLSAALLDAEVVPIVLDLLKPDQFYAGANKRVFGAILELAARGQPVDVVTVAGLLRDKGRLDQIGGTPYLATLADATPAVANVAAHAQKVIEKWRLRHLISTCQKFAADGYGDTGDVQAFVDRASAELRDIASGAGSKVSKAALSITHVLGQWKSEGHLVHEPTGLGPLDELTGGGPVYGTRWYLAGSPDAGKTALLVQLAHTYALRGIAVGLLAVDEEGSDIVTRFAQREGFSRSHCEIRDPMVLDQMGKLLGDLPLRIYDASWTIEDAAADLAEFAKLRAEQDPEAHPNGPRAMLGIDSVQTVRCAADALAQATGRELSEVSAVTSRVQAIRAVASRYRLIALATSELGRGAYRSNDPTQQTTTLASGKWSGAIEYSARVLIGLRSVADEPDLVELELAKNKHGPRDQKVYLRIDRLGQTLRAVVYDAPSGAGSDRGGTTVARAVTDAAVIARILLNQPGQGMRELRGAARAANGIGSERVDAALAALGPALVKGTAARGATPMSIDQDQLPPAVLSAMNNPN